MEGKGIFIPIKYVAICVMEDLEDGISQVEELALSDLCYHVGAKRVLFFKNGETHSENEIYRMLKKGKGTSDL
ncbi:MAG: hypothetical protein AAF487_02250 [Bacteroidota bacterium]